MAGDSGRATPEGQGPQSSSRHEGTTAQQEGQGPQSSSRHEGTTAQQRWDRNTRFTGGDPVEPTHYGRRAADTTGREAEVKPNGKH